MTKEIENHSLDQNSIVVSQKKGMSIQLAEDSL